MMFVDCVFIASPNQKALMMKLNELNAALAEISTQIDKARAEIVAKIAALELALTDVPLPDDANGALLALKSMAQLLDDIVPDEPSAGA